MDSVVLLEIDQANAGRSSQRNYNKNLSKLFINIWLVGVAVAEK